MSESTDNGVHTTPFTIVTADELDPEDFAALVASAANGALVTFSGVVRDHDDDRPVMRLDYHAHPDSGQHLSEIVRDVAANYPGCRFAVGHRHGMLSIGDTAIVAAVASAHRAEAFAACDAVVTTVKHRLPMWKHQIYLDGSSDWVNCS